VAVSFIPEGIRACSGIGRYGIGAEEGVRQGAVGRRVVRCEIDAGAQGDGRWCADCQIAVLAVVDSAAIGQHVDVGALGPELAVALGEVLAYCLRSHAEIMAEGTGDTSLTSALAEELAGNVRCIRWAPRPVKSVSSRDWAHHAIGTGVLALDVETAASRVVQIGGRHGFVADDGKARWAKKCVRKEAGGVNLGSGGAARFFSARARVRAGQAETQKRGTGQGSGQLPSIQIATMKLEALEIAKGTRGEVVQRREKIFRFPDSGVDRIECGWQRRQLEVGEGGR
jgi:hypothetical protein